MESNNSHESGINCSCWATTSRGRYKFQPLCQTAHPRIENKVNLNPGCCIVSTVGTSTCYRVMDQEEGKMVESKLFHLLTKKGEYQPQKSLIHFPSHIAEIWRWACDRINE